MGKQIRLSDENEKRLKTIHSNENYAINILLQKSIEKSKVEIDYELWAEKIADKLEERLRGDSR